VGARYAAIGVLAVDGQTLAEFVTSGMTDEERTRIGALPSGRGLLGLVIREPTPIRTTDIAKHPQRHGFPPHHPPMTSFLGVPIQGRGRVFGNLYLTDKLGASAFDAEDEAIAVSLASQAAVAVENARLNDEARGMLSQVKELQRQRDLFFAMMNHELRNALTGVYGWAERLLRLQSLDALKQAAQEVYESAGHTITLLNNLLDLSRLDAGKVRPVVRDFDVAPQLQRALSPLRPAAEARGIDLEVRCEAAPSLRTDPVRFEQIILNLVSNAIRHGPAGRPVGVAVDSEGGEIRFRVSDCGSGIPPALHEKIFEAFERFDPDSGMGSGLGLPVARRLAQLLGGSLTVDSDIGRGATFSLVLPLKPQE
jgi:signal transduction histidine kinase